MSAPLSVEEIRILRAAADGRLGMNSAGRYVIAGDVRPERQARDRLMHQRHLLTWRTRPAGLVPTEEGRAYLALLDADEDKT